jgi:hypothetical protein
MEPYLTLINKYRVIKGNEMYMKLFHFTEKPIQDYFLLVQKGKIRMPESLGTKELSFMRTEEEQKEALRKTFEVYSAAKIVTDGFIVPNIVLSNSTSMRHLNSLFEEAIPSQFKFSGFCLSFMTATNKLYQIDFDYYFLKLNHSVFVTASYLSEINGSAKSFDILHDTSS